MTQKKFILLTLILFIILTVFLAGYAFSVGQSSNLIASGAVIKTIQSGFQGTEGPATDADGNVYFSDMMQQRIYKWTWKDGKVTVYRENTGMGNGTMFDPNGNLIVCEMANSRVIRDDMKGNVTVIADSCNGKKLANPNDVWVAPNGGIYVSVFSMGGGPGGGTGGGPGSGVGGMPSGGQGGGMPGSAPGDGTQGGMPSGGPGDNMPSGPSSGGTPEGMPGGATAGAMPGGTSSNEATGEIGIFYISPELNKVTQVTTDIAGPNGIIGTPDGNTIYIGDNNAKKIWSYRINPDGTLIDKKLFCESETDGMAMDEKNNVYLTTRQAILIYSPAGELLEKIEMERCSNITFCGKDRKTLFITYHGNIYTLEMTVKGAPTALDMAGDNK